MSIKRPLAGKNVGFSDNSRARDFFFQRHSALDWRSPAHGLQASSSWSSHLPGCSDDLMEVLVNDDWHYFWNRRDGHSSWHLPGSVDNLWICLQDQVNSGGATRRESEEVWNTGAIRTWGPDVALGLGGVFGKLVARAWRRTGAAFTCSGSLA